MRQKLYFLFLVLLFITPYSLISCSEEDDAPDTDSDYIEITFNNKTYRETIPSWGYNILDGTETDSVGNRISLTNVMFDEFEDKYGFSFCPGIAHYSKKEDLMAAKPGTYPHQDIFGNITEGEFFCKNFTLVTGLDIFDTNTYYRLKNGTHQVTSIKEVEDYVQIEGKFDGIYEDEDTNKKCEIQGKYRMTLDVHNSNNPLD